MALSHSVYDRKFGCNKGPDHDKYTLNIGGRKGVCIACKMLVPQPPIRSKMTRPDWLIKKDPTPTSVAHPTFSVSNSDDVGNWDDPE